MIGAEGDNQQGNTNNNIFDPKNQNTHQNNTFNNFKFKREQFSVNIRRAQRQQIFTKKRGLSNTTNQNQKNNEKSIHKQIDQEYVHPECVDSQIVDPRFYANIRQYRNMKYTLSMLPILKQAMQNPDILQKHYGIVGVRKIMSYQNKPPIQQIFQAGLLPLLIQFVKQQQYPHLKLEATWTLSNIATGPNQYCQVLAKFGIIPIFIYLLQSDIYGIVQQAMWGIGNISCGSSVHTQQILKLNGMTYMLFAINRAKTPYIIQHGAWAISNLCRGKKIPEYQIIKDGIYALAIIVAQDRIRDKSILADCCWAISYSIKIQHDRLQMLIDAHFHTRVIQLLQQVQVAIILPVLRIVGRLIMGDQNQSQSILNQPQLIETLKQKLIHPKMIIRAQTCWALSNIAAGSRKYIQKLLQDQQLIGTLLNLLESDVTQIRVQVAHFLANLTIDGTPQQILYFYKQNKIIPHLFYNLNDTDNRLVKAVIDDLYPILAFGQSFKIQANSQNPIITEIIACSGTQILQQLQQHQDKQIYQGINRLLLAFFRLQEDPNNNTQMKQ